jgi:hypothetical protein
MPSIAATRVTPAAQFCAGDLSPRNFFPLRRDEPAAWGIISLSPMQRQNMAKSRSLKSILYNLISYGSLLTHWFNNSPASIRGDATASQSSTSIQRKPA